MTVTGRTMRENLRKAAKYPAGQDIVRGFDNPIKPSSHLVVFRGNLCPGGAVGKISGKEGLQFSGKAIVFEREEEPAGDPRREVKKGHVIIIRGEGPRGGPGMREMLSPTSAIMGKGLGGCWSRSPTAGSAVVPTASSSDTLRRKPSMAGPSP